MTDTTGLAIPAASAITRLEDVAQIRSTWLDSKRQELIQAEQAAGALERLYGADSTRVKTAVKRVGFLRRVLAALERGMVPIPRFSASRLTTLDELPVSAIVALDAAGATKVFDEVLFVQGDVGETRRGRRRRAQRDPLLVGVVRMTGTQIPEGERNGWGPTHLPGREEHFLIAWWRPEDERDEVMF